MFWSFLYNYIPFRTPTPCPPPTEAPLIPPLFGFLYNSKYFSYSFLERRVGGMGECGVPGSGVWIWEDGFWKRRGNFFWVSFVYVMYALIVLMTNPATAPVSLALLLFLPQLLLSCTDARRMGWMRVAYIYTYNMPGLAKLALCIWCYFSPARGPTNDSI